MLGVNDCELEYKIEKEGGGSPQERGLYLTSS